MKIAVLDANITQSKLICSFLNSAKHQTQHFSRGKDMLQNLHADNVDMLILDWRIPDQSASEVMRWIRKKLSSTFPVLFLIRNSDEDGIIQGLEAGTNDYIVKPLRRHEFNLRVQAQLRRAYPNQQQHDFVEFGDYVFETRSAQLTLSRHLIQLTQKEFDLALLLFRNVDRPLSRAFILDAIWPQNNDIPSRTIDTHISRVRNKLKLHSENGYQLTPVYSFGYQLLRLK